MLISYLLCLKAKKNREHLFLPELMAPRFLSITALRLEISSVPLAVVLPSHSVPRDGADDDGDGQNGQNQDQSE